MITHPIPIISGGPSQNDASIAAVLAEVLRVQPFSVNVRANEDPNATHPFSVNVRADPAMPEDCYLKTPTEYVISKRAMEILKQIAQESP
jgi:hypothetical protein